MQLQVHSDQILDNFRILLNFVLNLTFQWTNRTFHVGKSLAKLLPVNKYEVALGVYWAYIWL